MISYKKICAWCIVIVGIPAGVLAQPQQQSRQQASGAPGEEERLTGYFNGTIYGEVRHKQNALEVPSDEQQVDELQTEYGASLDAGLDRQLVQLLLGYDFYETQYHEDSQNSEFTRTGEAALTLGNRTTFYQLDVSHSSRRVLRDPTGPTIIANSDQRDIFTVSPLLRLQPGRGNDISINALYSEVRYDENSFPDSERVGAGIQWMREISPLTSVGVGAMQNEVDYIEPGATDYTYNRAYFTINSDLRRLTYSIDIGANEAKPDVGESFSGLFAQGSALFSAPSGTFTLRGGKEITDSSQGNGNAFFLDTPVGSGGGSSQMADQLELTYFSAAWRSGFVCPRCEVGLSGNYEEEEYSTLEEQNRTEVGTTALFAYRLRPTVIFRIEPTVRRLEFDPQSQFEDFSEITARATLEFTRLLRHFGFQLWYEYEERDQENVETVTTDAVGARLSYTF